MSGPVVIYGLRCPVDGSIRYIGKTDAPARRLKNHLGARNTARQLDRWIRSLAKRGLAPTMDIIRDVPAGADWANAEREEIARGVTAGWRLFNQTLGARRQKEGDAHVDVR